MSRCEIHADGDNIFLKTPYIEDFVSELKGRIPARRRRWDPDVKMWWVHSDWTGEAIALAAEYYTVKFASDDHAPPDTHPSPTPAAAWAELWLVPGAPPEVVAAAYRAMAKLHHPDHGGDTKAMQRVNAAYEEIRGER